MSCGLAGSLMSSRTRPASQLARYACWPSSEIVMSLIRLRDDVTGRAELGDDWRPMLEQMQVDIATLVNTYFMERLNGIPQVREYLAGLEH